VLISPSPPTYIPGKRRAFTLTWPIVFHTSLFFLLAEALPLRKSVAVKLFCGKFLTNSVRLIFGGRIFDPFSSNSLSRLPFQDPPFAISPSFSFLSLHFLTNSVGLILPLSPPTCFQAFLFIYIFSPFPLHFLSLLFMSLSFPSYFLLSLFPFPFFQVLSP